MLKRFFAFLLLPALLLAQAPKVTVTTRAGSGAALTFTQADKNFTDLQAAANASQRAWGQKDSTTTGLTWGYYGGPAFNGITWVSASDGTIALTASATNYIERTAAGVVSKNTTGWTAGKIPLALVVTGSSTITSTQDFRAGAVAEGTSYLAPYTGAVARTQSNKNIEAVSIKDFGAVGDGSIDDTSAINAALAASKHVIVPAGMTPRITSTVTVPSSTRLDFLGGLGNTNSAFPASYFIKKASMTTVALILSDRARVDGGGLICETGNTGDGVVLQGNNARLSNFLVHKAGGVGIRVGIDAAPNTNSFMLDHVTSQYNGSHGIYVHDGSGVAAPNVNAGTIIQPFCQYNGGDGIRLGCTFWTTVINGLCEINTGYGLYMSGAVNHGYPECRYATILGGDYNEGNTAGVVYDNSYRSTILNPDANNVPVNAVSGSGGFRNYIGGEGNTLQGLTVSSGASGASLLTAYGVYAGGITYPSVIQKWGTGSNGDGVGLQFKMSDNGGAFRTAAQIATKQYAGNKEGLVFFWNSAGSQVEFLSCNPNVNKIYPSTDNVTGMGDPASRWLITYTGNLQLSTAATSGAAGTVTLGGTTATTVGAAGGAAALPATPLGYINIYVAGVAAKIPYYSQ